MLSGSGWIFDQAAPGLLQGLLRLAAHQAVLAVAFWLASLRAPRHPTPWAKVAAAYVAIFAIPPVLFAGAAGAVSSLDEILVYLLVPVAVVIVVAQRSTTFGADENPIPLITPALTGLAGAALLLEFDMPATLVGKFWLAATVLSAVLAAVAAVRLRELLKGVPILLAAAIVCAATSLTAIAFCRVGWTGIPAWDRTAALAEGVRCLALEAPILLLTIWLLREMQPIRFSARLLLIPVVTIVEGLLFMRPPLTWTAGLGLLLMLGGAVGLLWADSNEML